MFQANEDDTLFIIDEGYITTSDAIRAGECRGHLPKIGKHDVYKTHP